MSTLNYITWFWIIVAAIFTERCINDLGYILLKLIKRRLQWTGDYYQGYTDDDHTRDTLRNQNEAIYQLGKRLDLIENEVTGHTRQISALFETTGELFTTTSGIGKRISDSTKDHEAQHHNLATGRLLRDENDILEQMNAEEQDKLDREPH